MYIVISYVTISPSSTATGSFLCLYVAVVPFCNVGSNIFGTLVGNPNVVNSLLFIFVIYLRKAKSNNFSGACVFVIV